MQRSDRVGDEIRTVVAEILRTGIKDPRLPEMVSVVEVKASRDLSHAHIYISVFGNEQQKKDCLAALRSASGFIRREITRKVRLRISPELHFEIDDSIARGIRMSQLIDEAMAAQAVPAAPADPAAPAAQAAPAAPAAPAAQAVPAAPADPAADEEGQAERDDA